MNRPGRTLVAGLLIASLALTSGCSFVFVERPHQISPGRYAPGDCTTSRAAPAADVIIALLQGFRTILALSLSDDDYRGLGISRDSDIIAGTGLTVLFAASASYGVNAITTCRNLGAGRAGPYQRPEAKPTSEQRRAEEAAEEAAVRARLKAKAAADPKAAGEAAGAAPEQRGDGDEP